MVFGPGGHVPCLATCPQLYRARADHLESRETQSSHRIRDLGVPTRQGTADRLLLSGLAEQRLCRARHQIRRYGANKRIQRLPAVVDGQCIGEENGHVARNESLARLGHRARIEKTYGLLRSHGSKEPIGIGRVVLVSSFVGGSPRSEKSFLARQRVWGGGGGLFGKLWGNRFGDGRFESAQNDQVRRVGSKVHPCARRR